MILLYSINSNGLIEENIELKAQNLKKQVIITELTKGNVNLKLSEENYGVFEPENHEKTKGISRLSHKSLQINNEPFSTSQIALHKSLVFEQKYEILQKEYNVLSNKNESLIMNIDSQNDIIKELKKVPIFFQN